jgi:hypothetical protein
MAQAKSENIIARSSSTHTKTARGARPITRRLRPARPAALKNKSKSLATPDGASDAVLLDLGRKFDEWHQRFEALRQRYLPLWEERERRLQAWNAAHPNSKSSKWKSISDEIGLSALEAELHPDHMWTEIDPVINDHGHPGHDRCWSGGQGRLCQADSVPLLATGSERPGRRHTRSSVCGRGGAGSCEPTGRQIRVSATKARRFSRRAFSFAPLRSPAVRRRIAEGAAMFFTKVTVLVAVLALGACAALNQPTPIATSQAQNAAPKQAATKAGEHVAPEAAVLKPFPPDEPPPVITAIPDYGSAN